MFFADFMKLLYWKKWGWTKW